MGNNTFHIWLFLSYSVAQALWLVWQRQSVVVVVTVLSSSVFPSAVFVFDWVSNVFLEIVLAVSTMVFLYSYRYIEGLKSSKKFYSVLALFCLSMVVLSTSGDVFWVIVGWDGLGITSLCLVVFFQNWNALSGGLVTFLSNRFGDLFFISSIGLMFLSGEVVSVFSGICYSGSIVLVIGSMTKSAQIPFSAWLPMAMAAPTPVSSLVHSSTLVTAGVFILARFIDAVTQVGLSAVYLMSSVTILVAGTAALFEQDSKKVVAYSTLMHVGLMVNLLSLGSVNSALMHMSIHAFFKSLLFIGVGVAIHGANGWQDLRRVGQFINKPEWVMITASLLSMIGVPFLSGFCSKELLIMSVTSAEGVLISAPFWAGVSLTVGYSIRLLSYMVRDWFSSVIVNGESVFCWQVVVVGGVICVCGMLLSWDSLEFKLVAAMYFGGMVKTLLASVVLLGLLAWLVVMNWDVHSSFLSVAWNVSSFVYFANQLTCGWGWVILNNYDVKGILGKGSSSLALKVNGFCDNIRLYWESFFPVLSVILTVVAVLVILGCLGV